MNILLTVDLSTSNIHIVNFHIPDLYKTLDQYINDKKGWSAPLELNISPVSDPNPQYLDICTVLNGDTPIALPSQYNGLESKKRLIIDLKISAIKSGFALVQRTSKSQKQLKNDNLLCYISLRCQHGIKYDPKDKVYKQVYKSKYCAKLKECCNFRVNISLCGVTNIWSIHHIKGKNKHLHSIHTGHFKLSPSHIHTQISMMPPKEIELAKNCSQINMTNSSMASLVSIRDALGIGNTWNRFQIRYQNKIFSDLNDLEPDASSAEKLIKTFQKRTDCNYLYVTYKPSEGLVMMTGKMYVPDYQ